MSSPCLSATCPAIAEVVTWAFTVAATIIKRAAKKNNRICFTITFVFKKYLIF